MDQTTQGLNKRMERKEPLTITPLVEVERTCLASIDKVWKAWTTPELMKQWWGPKGYSCPEAFINFKVGGEYFVAMKENATGTVHWSKGIYEQIIPNEKIVCTDHFADEKGNLINPREIGMPGEWPEVLYMTVHFEVHGPDVTHLKLTHEGIPAEMHDDCVQGWSSTLDKFQKLVERH